MKYNIDKSGFEHYLKCQLDLNKEMFTVVSYKKDESGTQTEVQFSSTSQARYAQQLLSQRNSRSRMIVSLQQMTSTDVSNIYQIRKSSDKHFLLQEHKKKCP